jgi:hypothetical protein
MSVLGLMIGEFPEWPFTCNTSASELLEPEVGEARPLTDPRMAAVSAAREVPMDQSIVRLLIREKLANGCLPSHSITRIWGVPGSGQTCDGCGGTVIPSQMLMQGELDARGCGVRFHVACFSVWDVERQVPDHEPSERIIVMSAPFTPFDATPVPSEPRARICPHCRSANIMLVGRLFADSSGAQSDLQCRECGKGFLLLTAAAQPPIHT